MTSAWHSIHDWFDIDSISNRVWLESIRILTDTNENPIDSIRYRSNYNLTSCLLKHRFSSVHHDGWYVTYYVRLPRYRRLCIRSFAGYEPKCEGIHDGTIATLWDWSPRSDAKLFVTLTLELFSTMTQRRSRITWDAAVETELRWSFAEDINSNQSWHLVLKPIRSGRIWIPSVAAVDWFGSILWWCICDFARICEARSRSSSRFVTNQKPNGDLYAESMCSPCWRE